jgi:hypothetical protein
VKKQFLVPAFSLTCCFLAEALSRTQPLEYSVSTVCKPVSTNRQFSTLFFDFFFEPLFFDIGSLKVEVVKGRVVMLI